jgi:phosphonate degradation associated HDIG domain protein
VKAHLSIPIILQFGAVRRRKRLNRQPHQRDSPGPCDRTCRVSTLPAVAPSAWSASSALRKTNSAAPMSGRVTRSRRLQGGAAEIKGRAGIVQDSKEVSPLPHVTTAIIDQIFALFERFGSESYGEHATQLQHALQVAELARREGCAPALIAASLLHDIGQFLDDAGHAAEKLHIDARHEVSGAKFLEACFPPEVYEPVRLHVAAKRYLCAVDSAYLERLSPASTLSLKYQGGPMTPAEVRAFEAERFHADAVTLRRFDDTGKQPEWYPPGLTSYRPLLESLLLPPPLVKT